jgi:hypothetical protein
VWTCPLRPARYATSRLGDHAAVRAARLVTRPLVAAADAAIRAAGWGAGRLERPAGVQTTPLEARQMAELLPAMSVQYALVPAYDEAALRWLLDRAAERSHGAVERRLVRSADGQPAGWYVYTRRGVVGQVVQVAAREDRLDDVLKVLAADVRDGGLAAVGGRLVPAHLHQLAGLGCTFARGGPWTLVHARRPELADAILAGDAFLSRLDGEWLTNF